MLAGFVPNQQPIPDHPLNGTDAILIAILVLLLVGAVCIGLALVREDKKPDSPGWWNNPDDCPEPVWPGGGAIPPEPKKEEREKTTLAVGFSKR